MYQNNHLSPELIQGSPEWLALRKTKITATDAPVIMGVSPWKTKYQLYQEKISSKNNDAKNFQMQRGIDLEPIAREYFKIKTSIEVLPEVKFHPTENWLMASLDGFNDQHKIILEIKCQGEADHSTALDGKIPDHYYPQLQHQMMVCNIPEMYYLSFDGLDGAMIKVTMDREYTNDLFKKEKEFYECLKTKTPPDLCEKDYLERTDEIWKLCATKWKAISSEIKSLEDQEKELRNQLIQLSGQYNTKGSGIRLCQIQRKGNVDYSSIPQLKDINLDIYRKPASSSWRLTCE
jgi:putative phage-type endonuclease